MMSISLALFVRVTRRTVPWCKHLLTSPVRWKSNISSFKPRPHALNHERSILLLSQRCASSSSNHDLGSEIYVGPLSRRILSVKRFSLATSLCGLMVQPLLIQKILEGSSIGVSIFSGVILQFFTFITPVLLHYVTRRYVRVIYFNSDSDMYTALTYDFWTANKLLSFKADDVVVPDIPGMFTSVIVKGTPLFLEASYFEDLGHYKRIMGFDKPIDFKLEDKSTKP